MTPIVVDAVLAHITPVCDVAFGERNRAHTLMISWGGFHVERDVTAFYEAAADDRDGAALQKIKQLAHGMIVDLARAIAREVGFDFSGPEPGRAPDLTPHDEAVLRAELEMAEDEGELH